MLVLGYRVPASSMRELDEFVVEGCRISLPRLHEFIRGVVGARLSNHYRDFGGAKPAVIIAEIADRLLKAWVADGRVVQRGDLWVAVD